MAGRAQPLSWPAARHARPADLEDLAIDATPTPPPAPGPGGPDRLDLIDVHWERVQLVIRGRWGAGSDRTPVPAAVHLRRLPDHHGGDPTRGSDVARSATPMSMAPTGGRIDGDELLLRFNVMSGPDRMPLEPGSWRLEVAGRPLVVVATAGPPLPAASFVLARGEYVAAPHVDPGDGSFRLAVSLDPTRARPAGGGGLAAEPADAGGGGPLSPSRGGGGLAGWPRRIAGVARKTVFRALYRMARLVPRRGGRRVLFASDSRAELGGNLAVVWDRMIARGLDRRLDMRTLFKPGIAARRPLVDRLRLPWLLATSDVILIDDYLPIVYRIDDPKVRIIQLWHASGAFKTVGYSRVGKPGGPSPYSRIHKNYTYAIVSSTSEVAFYAEAFGIPESRVIPTGIPRMDRFFELMRASRDDKDEFLTPQMEGFFRDLVRTFAPLGMLHLGVLTLDGAEIAMTLSFENEVGVYLYNSGYDPTYSYLSVGLVSKAMALEDAIERGKRRFDFLRGDEDYKRRLGGVDRELVRVRLASS